MSIIVPSFVIVGIAMLGWGLLRLAIADKGSRDMRAMIIILVALALLSAGLWWLSLLL